jgi:hypothetical protein
MIKNNIVSLFAGLSVGLMFCLYFVKEKKLVDCHSNVLYTCNVVGPNVIQVVGNNQTNGINFFVALETE